MSSFKILGVAMTFAATSAFAGGLPLPSFKDAPELYEQAASQRAVAATSAPRSGAARTFAAALPGFPVPSFNDTAGLYERVDTQRDIQPRMARAAHTGGALHPDPMHDSY